MLKRRQRRTRRSARSFATPSMLQSTAPLHPYRDTSLRRNKASLGPFSRTMPRDTVVALGGGGVLFEEEEEEEAAQNEGECALLRDALDAAEYNPAAPVQGYLAQKKQPPPLGPP